MTKNQLVKIIQNVIPDSNIDINAWQMVLKQHEVFPSIFHLLNTVEYYVAYFSQNRSVNLSLVVYNNKQPVGLMPLMVHQNEHDKWILSGNGVEIIEPIFIPTLARKVKKRLESQLAELIFTISSKLDIEYCQFTNIEYKHLSSWYLMWTGKSSEVFSTHHLLVDLSLSLDDIRLKFRKSFKPLINKGLREWKIKVHEQVSEKIFEQFRLLHKDVAGRSTRPIESWNEQRKQIDSLDAFLIVVSDTHDRMVGAGLFTYSCYQGLYSVGVYKRELFDKPIGHVVQMKAIETLKKKGVIWYEIGQKHLMVDKVPATDKELSISHFKEGFCTHVIARQHLIVKMY
jgi:FemAB family protein